MPIYEYRCGACAHHLEALQKMSEGPLRKCPECGKSQLRRLVSAPQFRLKGSGWYETDFKKDGDRKRNLAGDGGAAKGDSKGDAPGGKPAEPAKKADPAPAKPDAPKA